MADGHAGLMQFPFWLWTHNAGVGQEYIDHYYWAIAIAGNKMFPDFCEQPEDRMAGRSILFKTVNDLANGWHPNLKKLVGGATSRTYYEHVLGHQDGLYHILHVLSPRGALCDLDTGQLPALTAEKDANGNAPRPLGAWGHDYPAAAVALQSLSGPWAEPWLAAMIDEKPLPWHSLVEKEGDPVTTWFGENYGLASIRQKPQRIHALGHWRRKTELPSSMRDVGTLDLRVGFNQTRIANDGEGVISEQGRYRVFQHRGKLILLARPQPAVIARQAAEHPFGQRKLPAQEIRSVQCTAALFNYEQPRPSWSIFVDDRKVEALPAAATYGQVITIQDGVSYLAIRPLPTDDLGRDVEVGLEAGQSQTQPYHEFTNIQPALLINAYLYKRNAAIGGDAMKRLESAQTGFVVEMGDAAEHGSFEKFRAHVRGARLGGDKAGVTYQSGPDSLAAGWDAFTVNGKDPGAALKEGSLWQDTPLSQMGRRRLEKNGAVVERGSRHPELSLFLHAFPRQKLYVASNPLPNYLDFRFREPGGIGIVADGACSMGRWAVKDSREIDIAYHAFGDPYRAGAEGVMASLLFITGARDRPRVTLNGNEVTAALKPWKQGDADGWLVSLAGAFPGDEQIRARLQAATAAFGAR